MFNHTTLANRRPLSSPRADATFSSRPTTTQHQIKHHHHLQELLVPITHYQEDKNIIISVDDQAVRKHEHTASFGDQAVEEVAIAVHSYIVLKRSLRHKEPTLCPPLSTSVSIIVKKKVTILKNRQSCRRGSSRSIMTRTSLGLTL